VAASNDRQEEGPRGVLRVKPGVLFTTIAPAGFRLLAAIDKAARVLSVELTITSACDGEHSGPNDPHHRGEAYDVRTHGLTDGIKDAVLRVVLTELRDNEPALPRPVEGTPRSLATVRFFGFLESAGGANEHLHFQLRRGRVYP
jgi:hypothetical protein